MANAVERLARVEGAINEGRTVYVQTCTRITKVTPKLFKSFAASGHPVFKVKGDSLYMISGKSYVCIDFAALSASA